jgi:hypothetical protein
MMAVGHLAMCCLLACASLAASVDDTGTDLVTSALVVDDACAGAGVDEQGECAVNAMQLRVAKAQVPASRVSRASMMASSAKHPVLQLELFRPMAHKDLHHELSNVDMYSIEGVLHHLHTRVVWEHEGNWDGMQDPRLDGRAVNVDIIAGMQARVRNPDSVIAEVGSVNNFVDFAANAAFVDGMATGPRYNWDYGDIVGVAGLRHRAYPTRNPYYQFSLSGFCPNLLFKEKRARPSKQSGSCMKYSDHYNLPQGETLKGGLCPNGRLPGAMPTGGPGCAYTYTPPTKDNITSLDDLVGITQQSCGGRRCKNWQDWRLHCTNRKYKVMFNYKEKRHFSHRHAHGRRRHSLVETDTSPTFIKTSVCVEYDIHKACAKDCNSRACRRVPEHRREVGLPFWRGRCDPVKNARRAEMLAEALGIVNATASHKLVRAQDTTTCLVADSTAMCHPNPNTGGMYCSRAWAGVCQPCYIPGTVEPYPENKTTPACPWSILRSSADYADPVLHPKCASDLPRDLCCLYTNTCDSDVIEDVMNISTNASEDSFAYVSSLQNTKLMKALLGRAAYESFGISLVDDDALNTAAYWEWGQAPILGASLENIMASVKVHLS